VINAFLIGHPADLCFVEYGWVQCVPKYTTFSWQIKTLKTIQKVKKAGIETQSSCQDRIGPEIKMDLQGIA